NEAALKLKADERAATAAADTHQKAVAELPGQEADATKKALIAGVMQEAMKDPAKGAAAIDAALPPTTDAAANSAYKAAWQAAMGAGKVEGAARIVETAAQHATAISPATRAAHVQQAVDTEKATAPIRLAADIAKERALTPLRISAEVQKQVQLAKLAPEGFSTILSAPTRAKAEASYEKDSKEYAEKAGDAQRLK